MKQVNFRTNILLKNIIGKDLITDDNIAVLELVKNSYDAGSSVVELVFENVTPIEEHNNEMGNGPTLCPPKRVSSLLVCDNGIGMDEDGLINRWLNIAYSEKKDQAWMNGRRQAGNKGVGRFSCDRLGKQLTIYTKAEGEPCLYMSIDWTLFENESDQNKQIQELYFELKEIADDSVLRLTGWNDFKHGTILQITDLREQWTANKLLRLKRDLEKFINPNQSFQNDGFTIDVKAPEFIEHDQNEESENDRINGVIENKVFDRLNFKTTSIMAYVDEDGKYLHTQLVDRGRNVFELTEANPYPHLANVKMNVYYLNTYTKRYFNEQTGFRSSDFGSIFLFVNGFRVPPYGDQGDDWLGIERRKAMGYRRYLSTREVVGRIEVNNDNSDFKIITSRAGIVRNDAFEELSREGTPYGFFYKAFRRLERFVVEGIAWDKKGENISGETKGEEYYRLDDFSRNKQIISVIRKIIDVTDEEIIDLTINEELVQEILDKQMQEAQDSITSMLHDLSDMTSNLNVDGMRQYSQKLNEDSEEIDRLISIINTLSPNNNKLAEIQAVKRMVDEKQNEASRKAEELAEAKAAKERAEAEAERLRRELELEKEKNTYLLTSERTMSEDAKGMVHSIKLVSMALQANIKSLEDEVLSESLDSENVLKVLSRMRYNNEKSLKISKLITRANFRSDKEAKMINVVNYIKQYLEIYDDVIDNSGLRFIVEDLTTEYKRKLSTLDLAVVFDNLISNSSKAHSTEFLITPEVTADNRLVLHVSDNGDGLPSCFTDMPEKIFELGVTSTDGSGIGLYTVREVLKTLRGTIVYEGPGIQGKGASFIITL